MLFFIFLLLLSGGLYLIRPAIIHAESADAIAIRIIENPLHYSSLRWYQSQNFSGSPQSLQIDGYDAVRNGRTVYVDVANVVDKNSDGWPDFLDTNIFIVSFNQDAQDATFDTFGQLLKNLKFNANLPDSGSCSITSTINCLNDRDCPADEYCGSQKAKVIRDVKRLADLVEIKSQLDSYKQRTGVYPSLISGTYIANKTLSTWPSWQQSLNQELGIALPVDPINQLGACPDYNSITCWDETNKKFATDLSKLILPAGSHVYLYSGDNQGKTARYCAQTESGYKNIEVFNCLEDKKNNNPPTIKGINLTGQPKQEFSGYVSVYDLDGDPIKITIDLVNPAPSDWTENGWQWGAGLDKFSIISLPEAGQKKIYALKTGKNRVPGYYQIKLTLDDGQGEANSVYAKDYDVTINPLSASLSKAEKTIIIGGSDTVYMDGLDSNSDPITKLFFSSAAYNTTALSQAVLADNGFVLLGNSLKENFKSAQRTGVYTVNVYAQDLNTTAKKMVSSFVLSMVNNPPVFSELTATFSNNTPKKCVPGEQCSIAIDNLEPATVEIKGSDPDGHKLSYSLVDDFGGKLIINSTSGVVSGFEKLNSQQLTEHTFNISVKISDEYCSNSSETECSVLYSFNLSVEKYCSVTDPESTSQKIISGPFTISETGKVLNTGENLTNCSAVGTSSADITFNGQAHSQEIVLVSDLSASMATNVVNIPAISRLQGALTATTTGFLDKVYDIVKTWTGGHSTKIGLIAYNKIVQPTQNLIDVALPDNLENLKSIIKSYTTNSETNTLIALNEAEKMLGTTIDSNVGKVIILMSDGIPGINGYKSPTPYCYTYSCQCGEYPDCVTCCNGGCSGSIPADSEDCIPFTNAPVCNQYETMVCNKCQPFTCAYGGTYPNCIPSPKSSYNNQIDWKGLFSGLFKVKSAQAITVQSQCAWKDCGTLFPNYFESHCLTNQGFGCSSNYGTNCDLSEDVNIEASALKNSGVSIYTIYYDTSATSTPKQRMCDWSSNNGENCDKNEYAFAGTDIDAMINKVLGRVVTKPKDAKVGSSDIIDSDPTKLVSVALGAEIGGLACGEIKPVVTYLGNGSLEFSNLKINYCPAKLHP